MKKLKVLSFSIDYPFEVEDYFESNYKEIDPILNRDGFYFNRDEKKCWYEFDGRAFISKDMKSSIAIFKFQLDLLNTKILTDKEFNSLKFLIDSKVIKDRENLHLFYINKCIRSYREIYNSSRLECMESMV